MFGGIGWMVNGNMACGTMGDDLLVRLDREDSDRILAEPHVALMQMGDAHDARLLHGRRRGDRRRRASSRAGSTRARPTRRRCRRSSSRSAGRGPQHAGMPSHPAKRTQMSAASAAPTAEQLLARERWQARWNLPIILAALVPLFVNSPDARWVQVAVGLGSWVVFVVDLVVQRRIVPGYLHQRRGRFDLVIVLITFPYYLIPGVSGGSAILLLARLGRVVRVLLATAGLRRFVARLGKVAIVAGSVVLICSLAAYQAEHATNQQFATVGDALWWGIVTLTTVGYGDIVPLTTAGRFAGIAIMFTGIGVLGVLAGSLAELFQFDDGPSDRAAPATEAAIQPLHAELAALQLDLQTVERRLGDLVQTAQADTEAGA